MARDRILADILGALGCPASQPISFARLQRLPSAFAVSELAAASVASVGAALSGLAAIGRRPPATVEVDQRLASLWFSKSLRPEGWALPPGFDPINRIYRTADGWIRIHTNSPHHKAAALTVLGSPDEREAVAEAISGWTSTALETAIVQSGGCAAELRSLDAWAAHPQGAAVAEEPLIAWTQNSDGPIGALPAPNLHGVRVLDLTRILAGPAATRLLAGLGADVLRIDPPDWDEPSLVADVTLGKRCARLDLKNGAGLRTLRDLLKEADIVVHGYRPGALDRLGFGAAERAALRPGLVDVSLCAYGHTGPWSGRRGFDSLVQMSSGLAEAGQIAYASDTAQPLPVQALDHATGMMMAAAAIEGLRRRLLTGAGWSAQLSLARTAHLLTRFPCPPTTEPLVAEDEDFLHKTEKTPWGPAHRLRPPLILSDHPVHWTRQATELGAHEPVWH